MHATDGLGIAAGIEIVYLALILRVRREDDGLLVDIGARRVEVISSVVARTLFVGLMYQLCYRR